MMAGDWIKMRTDLFTHPKVVRISSALKADALRTVGGLMSVWSLFDAHSIDGELEGYTIDAIDDHLRWAGFGEAMKAVYWLEQTPQGLVLPEFDTHNGASAKRRAQDADRKREGRKTSAPEADKKRTREEKRRVKTTSHTGADDSFLMHLDWRPSEHMPDMAKQAGVHITPEALQEFIAYWLTQDKSRKQAEWDKALLQSLLHGKAKTASQPAGSGTTKPAKFDPIAYVNRNRTNGGNHAPNASEVVDV